MMRRAMNIDIEQLLQGYGIEVPAPKPIPNPGFIPNLYDVRAVQELQPTVPCEGAVPALWDEECSPIEAWYMGYLYSNALARMQYTQQLMAALRGILQEGTVPTRHVDAVLLVIKELDDQYKPEDIVWYEGRLLTISTKLRSYYSSPERYATS